MPAKYPLDLPPEGARQPSARSGSGITIRLAELAAEYLVEFNQWRYRRQDLSRAIMAILFLSLGVFLGAGAAITDNYLHRGMETGENRPYVMQSTGRELATNVDLRNLEPTEVETIARAMRNAGIRYVRQEFHWSEFESTRGVYEWSGYDSIVQTLSEHNIGVIAVVVDSPDWARNIGDATFDDAPPRSAAMLGDATRSLTDRYGDAVPYLQVWDRPNLASNWGGTSGSAAEFALFLESASKGAREGNANVGILTPELALAPGDPDAETDSEFLEGLYASGARAYFDIVGISLDGGKRSPDDRSIPQNGTGFSRAIMFRELLVDHDDPATPIWATSFGWSRSESLSDEEQAEYVLRAMTRSRSEWPWMGLMVHWDFLVSPSSPDQGYALVNADGTSTPLYRALSSDAVRSISVHAGTGFTPMEASAVSDSGSWEDQHLEGRTFRTTHQVGSSTTLQFRGTGLIAFVRSGPEVGRFLITLDGETISGGSGDNGDEWNLALFGRTDDLPRTLVDGLEDDVHEVVITLVSEGELTLGGFEVTRQVPFVWPIVMMALGALLAFFVGLRSLVYLFATRAGHLRRVGQIMLPGGGGSRVPSWRIDA